MGLALGSRHLPIIVGSAGGVCTATPVKSRVRFLHHHAFGNNEGGLSIVRTTSFVGGRQRQPRVSRLRLGRREGERGRLVGHHALIVNERKIKVLFHEFGLQIHLEVLEEIWCSINLVGGTVHCVNDWRSIDCR